MIRGSSHLGVLMGGAILACCQGGERVDATASMTSQRSSALDAPKAAIASTLIDFGEVIVERSSQSYVTLSNSGAAALSGTVAPCAGNPASFGFASASFSIGPGDGRSFPVTYSPAAIGVEEGCLTVTTNDSTLVPNPSSVSLRGTAIAAESALPKAYLPGAAVDFGNVEVGSSGGTNFLLHNLGEGRLDLAWSISGPDADEFDLPTTASIPPRFDSPWATQWIAFHPVRAGLKFASLRATTNDSAAPVIVLNLTGSAGEPAPAPGPRAMVDAQELTFANASLTAASRLSFTVRNAGDSTLTGTVALCSSSSPAFSVEPASFSLPVGSAAQTVTVTYRPTALGAESGCLSIATNDSAMDPNPAVVTLRGTATADLPPRLYSPKTQIDLGTAAVGQARVDQISFENRGGISSCVRATVEIVGANPEDFGRSTPLLSICAHSYPTTLSTPFAALFQPVTAGAKSASLRITTNEPVTRVLYVNLSGVATEPATPVNQPPVARIDGPACIAAGLSFFSGTSSYDPDSTPIAKYTWTIKSGRATVTREGPTLSYRFKPHTPADVTLTVADDGGLTGAATVALLPCRCR